jgi:hypothetical protein
LKLLYVAILSYCNLLLLIGYIVLLFGSCRNAVLYLQSRYLIPSGERFGELAFINRTDRAASVTALTLALSLANGSGCFKQWEMQNQTMK